MLTVKLDVLRNYKVRIVGECLFPDYVAAAIADRPYHGVAMAAHYPTLTTIPYALAAVGASFFCFVAMSTSSVGHVGFIPTFTLYV